jgi:hypothetical protein
LSKERKRSYPTHFRFGFGLQACNNLWWMPQLHPHSILGVQVLDGNLSSLLSYGSGLISISSPRRPQSLIYYRDLFWPRCCVTWFWPDRPCIKWGPIGTRSRV